MKTACFGFHATTVEGEGLLVSETVHAASLRTPPHAHPFLCLHFVLEGLYEEQDEGEIHRLGPGWLLFKPREAVHWNDFRAEGAQTLRVALETESLEADVVNALPPRSTALRSPHLAMLARRIHGELRGVDDLSHVIAESLVVELLVGLARLPVTAAGESRALARRCADLLENRFTQPCRLGRAAEELGVDRTALARSFRAEHGCSVGEYLRRRRLDYVAERLRNDADAPLGQLAVEAGFADQSHLTRTFKAEFGLPPGAWRRRHG